MGAMVKIERDSRTLPALVLLCRRSSHVPVVFDIRRLSGTHVGVIRRPRPVRTYS